jgi:hypothetical protein
MEKMTKRDYFAELRALAVASNRSDLVTFVDHELELLAKKNSARSTKPTKTQVANAGYMEDILACMETAHAYTVSEIAELVPTLKGFSVNKVSALMRGLKLDERVIRSEVKGKAYFTKAE